MKNIIIMPNAYKDPEFKITRKIASYLVSLGGRVFLSEDFGITIRKPGIHYYKGDFPKEAEVILVIGGDGSVLDAAVYAIGANLPLLGLNLGRLGYLAELDAAEYEVLACLFTGEYTVKERMTFDVSLVRGGEEMHLVRGAVNDVVVSQVPGRGMSEIRLEDGVGNHLTYLADGLIVATPLGSTAYSMAAGGPVVDSSLSAFCVTPICAHSIFSRSVLFPPEYTLTVRNGSRREGYMKVSVDGSEDYELAPGDSVSVCRSHKVLRMISPKNQSALGVLCRKMQLLNQRD